MEQVLRLLLPEIMVVVSVIVFTLLLILFIKALKKIGGKVKNLELHVGKHHWFKIEYK